MIVSPLSVRDAHWSGGKTQPAILSAGVSGNQGSVCSVIPSVGQAPRRRKLCADTAPASRAAAAPIDVVDFMANATESEVIQRTLERCDGDQKKAPGPVFIAPTALELQSELFAILGNSLHMGAMNLPGSTVHPRRLVAYAVNGSVVCP